MYVKLSDLMPAEPVVRCEHDHPGDLLHIGTKKLGRIERPSHRVAGNRRDSVNGPVLELLVVAADDRARIAYTAMRPDEKTPQAVQFLRQAVAYHASLGVKVRLVLNDNGSALRSRDFAATCAELGIVHEFTRAYRPQTYGKAERFIQSALREWACGWTYQNSHQRIPRPDQLATPPQLAPTACRHRRRLPHVQTQQVKEQPLDGSQLGTYTPCAINQWCTCDETPDQCMVPPVTSRTKNGTDGPKALHSSSRI